ncbi:fumble-domain-containing protein [Phakopsora pachyrhizi]|nr:fumble-domain-containing protein [Phakopsora pachyrhizi]
MSNTNRHLPTSTSTLRVDIRGAEIVQEDESPETSDIYLPKHTEFISHIALDIGGSLAKIVYFTRAVEVNDESKISSSNRTQSIDLNSVPNNSLDYNQPQSKLLTEKTTENDQISSSGLSNCTSELDRLAEEQPRGTRSQSNHQPTGILKPTLVREQSRSISEARRTDHKISIRTGEPLDNLTKSIGLSRVTSLPSSIPGGRLNFTKFETESIETECIPFINDLIQVSARSNRVPIKAMKSAVKVILTGGGAYKYFDRIKDAFGEEVEVLREEEMECLIIGLNFLTEIPDEVFWFSDELVQEIVNKNSKNSIIKNNNSSSSTNSSNQTSHPSIHPTTSQASDDHTDGKDDDQQQQKPPRSNEVLRPSPNPPLYSVLFDPGSQPQFPFMLVNIGSGVSIIKVNGFERFERISGTSLGGGTLWGLLSLLTDARSFDEMLDNSLRGDNSRVDMLVGDIYGQDYEKIGLKSSVIASSFGKVFKKREGSVHSGNGCSDDKGQPMTEKERFSREDISKSLLYAISNNIGQIANLNAEKHNLDRIYFGGCFIRGHVATVSTLSYAIRFWSQGKKRAYFLRHEGYLGSIGAWLKNISQES